MLEILSQALLQQVTVACSVLSRLLRRGTALVQLRHRFR